jgi:hypothetical protein
MIVKPKIQVEKFFEIMLKCRGSFAPASASDLSVSQTRWSLFPGTHYDRGVKTRCATFSHHSNIYGVKSVPLPRLSVSDIQKTGLRTSCAIQSVKRISRSTNSMKHLYILLMCDGWVPNRKILKRSVFFRGKTDQRFPQLS